MIRPTFAPGDRVYVKADAQNGTNYGYRRLRINSTVSRNAWPLDIGYRDLVKLSGPVYGLAIAVVVVKCPEPIQFVLVLSEVGLLWHPSGGLALW